MASFFTLTIFIRPAYGEINALRGDLSSKQETYENQQKIIDEVTVLLQKYESVSNLKDKISLVVPSSEDYATLVNQLGSLARLSNLFLESIQMNPVPQKTSTVSGAGALSLPTLRTLQVNMRLIGSYESLKDFLDKVETNIRIMDPAKISITPGVSTGIMTYELIVNTYYQSGKN
jgi:Tfp pilus assembly protein PilO